MYSWFLIFFYFLNFIKYVIYWILDWDLRVKRKIGCWESIMGRELYEEVRDLDVVEREGVEGLGASRSR